MLITAGKVRISPPPPKQFSLAAFKFHDLPRSPDFPIKSGNLVTTLRCYVTLALQYGDASYRRVSE